jgi:peptide/nickel transport system ATP-binding protein
VDESADGNTDRDGGPLLEVRSLRVSFTDRDGPREVLHGVDLTVPRGRRVAVVGASGSGKSTCAAATIGLLPGTGRVTGRSITYDGVDLVGAGERTLRGLRGRRIGLVPQDPMASLNPAARVGQQVAETLQIHGMARGAAARRRAVELLSEAGIPEAERRFRQYPHEFSGGLRQRVLIAIALACEPELLIADEPTSALDVTVQRQILDRLERLTAARGTALLLITHDLGLAADRADDVVVMDDGRVVESGPARAILRAPREDYTRRLVAAAPSMATESRAAPPPAGGERTAGLEVADLVKTYPVRGRREPMRAVDGVSFSVPAATTMALVGESGSGKTTVARLVLGLEKPTAGLVRIGGAALDGADRAGRRAIRLRMQPVFQDPYGSLDPVLTVEHLVDEPLRVFGLGDRAARRRRVAELLDHVALPRTTAQRHPVELSGGQRQRVAIARALACEPGLVICDEAVSALDVLVQDQILALLVDLQRDMGLSYLFITHDLAVVRLVAHDVLVMRAGRIVEHG